MSTTIKWQLSARSGNPVTVLSTELNSLAAGGAVVSATIDNDADLDTFADFELFVNFTGTPGLAEAVDLWAVRTVDGSNFEDASTTIFPRAEFLGSFLVHDNGNDQRLILPEIRLPPRDFKVLLHNQTVNGLEASGHVLKMLTYKLAVV